MLSPLSPRGAGHRPVLGAASYLRTSSPSPGVPYLRTSSPSPGPSIRPPRTAVPPAPSFLGAFVRDTSPGSPRHRQAPPYLGSFVRDTSPRPADCGSPRRLGGLASSSSGFASATVVMLDRQPQWADGSELQAYAPAVSTTSPSFSPPPSCSTGVAGDLEYRLRKTLAEEAQLRDVHVARAFRSACGLRAGLDLQAVVAFVGLLSQALSLPQAAFGLLQVQHARFDLNGNGLLEEEEAFALARCTLQEYLKRLGPAQSGVDSPQKSLAFAGYQIIKEVGRGNCGVLQLAIGSDGNPWCVKCATKTTATGAGDDSINNELEAMRTIDNHPNVARILEIFQDSGCHYLVTEPYYGGDFTQIKRNATARGVPMTEDWWRLVTLQCMRGLDFIHSRALLHCDIKEANLMCKTEEYSQPAVVIIDFGLCQPMAKERVLICGTPGYIPPEVWESGLWYPAGDIFSLGVSMAQLAVDKVPIVEQSNSGTPMCDRSDCRVKGGMFTENARTLKDVEKATRTRLAPLHLIPAHLPGFVRLLQVLLCKDPAGRPTASQALADAWLSGAVGSANATSLSATAVSRLERGRPGSMTTLQAALDHSASSPLGVASCGSAVRALSPQSHSPTKVSPLQMMPPSSPSKRGFVSADGALSPRQGVSLSQVVPAWARPEAAMYPESPMSRRRALAPSLTPFADGSFRVGAFADARDDRFGSAGESSWSLSRGSNSRRSLVEQACSVLAADRQGDCELLSDRCKVAFSPQLLTGGSLSASAGRSPYRTGPPMSAVRCPSPPRPPGRVARTVFASSGPRVMTSNFMSGQAREPLSPPLSPRRPWSRHTMSMSELTGV